MHVEKTENYEICLEVSGEVSDISIISSSWSDNSLVRVNQGDKTNSKYYKQIGHCKIGEKMSAKACFFLKNCTFAILKQC